MYANAHSKEPDKYCAIGRYEHFSKLQQFSYKKNWSNRPQIKVIRLARTISDLQGSKGITDRSIWEAAKLNSLAERKADRGIKANGR
ncbi:hypothetical protein [Cytobacillus firmus]|uniref:magnesium chelatase subunit ChlI family protein n=1 Tax=Cytobacillus firmus TaxID=1399 RepID=UPI0034A39725